MVIYKIEFQDLKNVAVHYRLDSEKDIGLESNSVIYLPITSPELLKWLAEFVKDNFEEDLNSIIMEEEN